MQHVYENMDFRSPLFLTFLTNSMLLVYLPLWKLSTLCPDGKEGVSSNSSADGCRKDPEAVTLLDDTCSDRSHSEDSYAGVTPVEELTPTTTLSVLRIAMILAPIYVLSNGLYNYSIYMTSISSSTIIRYAILLTIATTLRKSLTFLIIP
jgi:hypothetical protein